MIQRVQSIWLFLASITLFLLLILPVVTTQVSNAETWLQVGGIYNRANEITLKIQAYSGLFGLTIVAAIICLAAIFFFKNRSLQKNIILLAIVLIILILMMLGVYAYQLTNGFKGATINIGAVLPILSVIFCALAFRGIRKDEQLIRSADRLR